MVLAMGIHKQDTEHAGSLLYFPPFSAFPEDQGR